MENEFWNKENHRDNYDPFRAFLTDKENRIDRIKSMWGVSLARKQSDSKPYLRFGWNANRAKNQQGRHYWYSSPCILV